MKEGQISHEEVSDFLQPNGLTFSLDSGERARTT